MSTRVSIQDFYHSNFKDVFEIYGRNALFCGDKLYITVNPHLVVAVTIVGANFRSLNTLKLEAISTNGVLDVNEIPFNKIFYETRIYDMEKTVLIKAIDATSGGSTVEWSVAMSEDDINALNNIIFNYIAVFNSLVFDK